MNEILNSAADQTVCYLLIGSVAALILVLLAGVILKAARIQTPVYRHLIWLYCLIGAVVLPLLWRAGRKMTLAILPSRVQASLPAVPLRGDNHAGATAIEEFPVATANTEPQSATPAKPQAIGWKTAVAGAWLAGFAFMLTRLAAGWYRLRRICLSATPTSQRQERHSLDGRKLIVRLTRQLHGPVCFGLFRPVILLPEDMYEGGTAESLRMVLTHELAHLERRDAWVNLFQRIVEAAYFFHPLIWFASRQLTQQRERICDNYVLAEGVSPADYTTLLSRIGERAVRGRYLQTVALFEGQLLARIHSLLDPRGSRQTKLPRRVATICTAAVLTGFLVLGSVRLAAQPSSRATPASPKSPASLSPSTEQKSAPSSDGTAANSEKSKRPRFAARTFNSKLRLEVLVQETPESEQKWIRRTPSAAPLEIPACWFWSVQPSAPVKDWDLLVREMSQNKVPGLGLDSATTDSDVKHLADLTELQGLDLHDTAITDAGLAHFKGLTGLQELSLMNNRITDMGLAHFKGLTRLRYLNLHHTQITDAGLVHLQALTGLRYLALGYTQITDAGLEHLKDLTGLVRLGLSGTQITDAGLEHLQGLTGLRGLELADTRLTDAGIVHCKGMTGLSGLDLPGTKITDVGLAQLGGLTGLTGLSVDGTQITDAGLEHSQGPDRAASVGIVEHEDHGCGLGLRQGQWPAGLMAVEHPDHGCRTGAS